MLLVLYPIMIVFSVILVLREKFSAKETVKLIIELVTITTSLFIGAHLMYSMNLITAYLKYNSSPLIQGWAAFFICYTVRMA